MKIDHFHIIIREEDQNKTTFLLSWSKSQLKRMSQRLSNASFVFSDDSERLSFGIYDYYEKYVDDIFVLKVTSATK